MIFWYLFYCLVYWYSLAVTQDLFSLSACLSNSSAHLTVFPLVLQIFFSLFLSASVLQVSPAPLSGFALPTASYAQLIPTLSILLILHPPVILSQFCLSRRLSCLLCITNCLFVLQPILLFQEPLLSTALFVTSPLQHILVVL